MQATLFLSSTNVQLVSQKYISQQCLFSQSTFLHVSTFPFHNQGVSHPRLSRLHEFLNRGC